MPQLRINHGPSFSETFWKLAREAHEYRLSIEERRQAEKTGIEDFRALQQEYQRYLLKTPAPHMEFWEFVKETHG